MGAVLGGAAAGAWVAVLPHLPVRLSLEVLHARDCIAELVFLAIERLTPISVPAWLNGPAGVAGLFAALGALLGGVAWVAARLSGRYRARFASGFAVAAGAFVSAASVALVKTMLFYPTRSVLSWRGAAWLTAITVFSAVTALLLGLLLRLGGRPAAAIVLAVLALAGGWTLRPRAGPASIYSPPIERVVLIGVDGLSWNALEPLLAVGRLPGIGRIAADGSAGPLRAMLPIRSPLLWTSIATGLRSEGHGIRTFTSRSPETSEVLPISVGDRTAAALWDVCGLAGRRAAVINWHGGWPAEIIAGTFVSNRLGCRGLPDRIQPPERLAELGALAADPVILSTDDAARIALRLLEADRPDLLMVYFPELDHVQHRHWAVLEPMADDRLTNWLCPGPAASGASGSADPVFEELVKIDRFVAAALERIDDRTVVALVSDHGFGPARGPRLFRTDVLLERLGWRAPGPRPGETDWARTLIHDAGPDLVAQTLPRRLALNLRAEGPFAAGAAGSMPGDFLAEAEARLAALTTSSGRE